MTTTRVSVAIVGAGPAGACVANALLLAGAKNVALIDRARFPRDKCCGDGIGPGAVQVMKSLGLGDRLSAHQPVHHLSVSGPSGAIAKGPLPEVAGSLPVGYTIPRLVFDDYLAQAAIERGAIDLTGCHLQNADNVDDGWQLTLKDTSGAPRVLTADVLIGADGARSRVRRALGVGLNSDRHTGTAVRIYAKVGPEFDALQFDFREKLVPGYGWVFPIDGAEANIGIGIDVESYKRGGQHMRDLLAAYRATLDGTIAYDELTYQAYVLPYGSELPRLAFPAARAALVGDAASMINPLTGEGIYYAMYAGELLGRLLAPALRSGSRAALEDALVGYQLAFGKRFQRHFALNWRIKERIEDPAICDIVVRACARDRVLLGHLIEMMQGDRKTIGLGTILRVVGATLPEMLWGSRRT